MNTTPHNCPDIGAWRAWLDQEEGPDALPQHLDDCPACRRLVAELQQDASDVGNVLAGLAPTRVPNPAEVAIARERLEWRRAQRTRSTQPKRIPGLEPVPMFFPQLSTRWRVAASAAAAAAVLVFVVAFTPAGNSAAAAFLAQFRSQQVSAIEVTPQSQAEMMRALSALGNLGTVQMPGVDPSRPQTVARAAEAQSRTATLAEAAQTLGFTLLTPDPSTLPAGVDKTPTVHLTPASQAKFTFDKNKARSYFQTTGHPGVSLPDKFDGATLSVNIPPMALLNYGTGTSSKNDVVVGEAGELVVDVQGNVSLPELRDFLLGLPGLPPAVVSQLKQIQDWNNTLPIPVPVDQVNWQSATINGSQGLLLNDNSGVGSAALWHANGHLYGVAGTLKATDLKRIADSLAVR